MIRSEDIFVYDKFTEKEKIYIFKVVSDYGETAIPDREKVIAMTEPYISVIAQL